MVAIGVFFLVVALVYFFTSKKKTMYRHNKIPVRVSVFCPHCKEWYSEYIEWVPKNMYFRASFKVKFIPCSNCQVKVLTPGKGFV